MKMHITHNLDRIPKELKKLSEHSVKRATARAVKETGTMLRKDLSMRVRQFYNLPASGSSKGGQGTVPPGVKDMIKLDLRTNAGKKTPLSSIFAQIRTDSKPISLIHFVRGRKVPAEQKGIPIKRRKKLKLQVRKGRTKTDPKAFIQRANGAVQVFKRGDGRSLKKQSVPAIFTFLGRPSIINPHIDKASTYYQNRLLHHLKFFAGKLDKK